MKSVWVLTIVLAFAAGSLVTGAAVFADDDDDLSQLACDAGTVMTGILFEDDDEILDVICDDGATGPQGPAGPPGSVTSTYVNSVFDANTATCDAGDFATGGGYFNFGAITVTASGPADNVGVFVTTNGDTPVGWRINSNPTPFVVMVVCFSP